MDIALSTEQFTTIHLRGITNAKKVGHFKQPPVWTLSTEGIVTTDISADGVSCKVTSADAAGSTTLTVDDIDNPLSAPLTINIVVSEPVITELEADVDDPTDVTSP